MDIGKGNLFSNVWRPHISSASVCSKVRRAKLLTEFLIWSNIISEIEVVFLSFLFWIILCYSRSLADIVLPKWCQIFLSSVQLVSSFPWGYVEDQMGKCWMASQGPSLHCPFWSPTFWSWHGAPESLCPSAVVPVAVPKTDFTSQPRIPAPDVRMLISA